MKEKMKVAKLVTFVITTRVIVNENENPEVIEEEAVNAAIQKLKGERYDSPFCIDNVEEIQNDEECPFGTFNDDLNNTLNCQLFGLYKKASDWLQGLNENVNELNIINEGADILLKNLEELASIKGEFEKVNEVLTNCAYFINKDFDHEVTWGEYTEMGLELVKEISECLGEFFY